MIRLTQSRIDNKGHSGVTGLGDVLSAFVVQVSCIVSAGFLVAPPPTPQVQSAFQSVNGEASSYRAGSPPARLFRRNGPYYEPMDLDVSMDGKRVAVSYGTAIEILDAETGLVVGELQLRGLDVRGPSFSPDGRRLAGYIVDRNENSVVVWSLPDGTTERTLRPEHGSYGDPLFSPDGQLLALLAFTKERSREPRQASIVFLDARDYSPVGAPLTPVADTYFQFSGDGQRLAALGDRRDRLEVWDLRGRKPLCSKKIGDSGFVRISRDARVAMKLGGLGIHVLDVASCTEVWTQTEQMTVVNAAAFSPDGELLAIGGFGEHAGGLRDYQKEGSGVKGPGMIDIWDVSSGSLRKRIKVHDLEVNDLIFLPQGRRLISASRDRTVKMLNVDTGELLWTGPLVPEKPSAP